MLLSLCLLVFYIFIKCLSCRDFLLDSLLPFLHFMCFHEEIFLFLNLIHVNPEQSRNLSSIKDVINSDSFSSSSFVSNF